jgi:hypothetical protein
VRTRKTMRLFKNQVKFSTARSCPFCGGIPKLSRCGDQRDLWYVRCTECFETPIDWGEAKVNPDKAVKIYNKRADFAEHLIRIYNRVKEKENEV